MKIKEVAESIGVVAGTIAPAVPEIIEHVSKKKEEKSFFEENKNWIYIIILSIFTIYLNYINMFNHTVLDSIINLIYGIIMFVLLVSFIQEENNAFKDNTKFLKTAIISLIVLCTINSFYHIGYAVYNIVSFI